MAKLRVIKHRIVLSPTNADKYAQITLICDGSAESITIPKLTLEQFTCVAHMLMQKDVYYNPSNGLFSNYRGRQFPDLLALSHSS